MDLQNLLISISSSVLDFLTTFSIVIFLHCFYDSGFHWHKKKTLMLLGLSFVSTILMCIFGYQSIIPSITFIGYAIVVIYDYSGNKIKSFLKFVWISLLLHFFVILVALVIQSCADPDNIIKTFDQSDIPLNILLYAYLLMCIFLSVILFYLYPQIYKKGVVMKAGKRERIFSIIFPIVIYALLLSVILSTEFPRLIYFIAAIAITLLCIVVPIFVFYSRINEYYRNRSVFQETFMQAELNHFQHYRQAQEETIRFRHDIKNNLLCMNEFLAQGKTEEAKNYLKDLLNIVDTLSTKYITGDEILDCIVAAKVTTMEQANISFRLDGVLAGGLPWKPVDVCAVFANAIDNAIEACLKLPPADRYININIKSTAQYWFISIVNPTDGKVDTKRLFQKKGGYTTKTDNTRHGIGTYNMKHTVESYGGLLKAEANDQEFTLEVMIDKNVAL